MGRELQAANNNQRLAEVAVSTYYMWQRKVFQAVSAKAEACFTEVPVFSAGLAFGSRAAVIHAGEMEIELSSGVDAATIRAIIEALRSCHHDLPESITVVCCWAHARHYFDEAVKSIPKGVHGSGLLHKALPRGSKAGGTTAGRTV